MAKIFVSHSRRDQALRDFFSTAFATTTVGAIYEEIEAIGAGRRTPDEIRGDIAHANAVFVLLGPNVEQLQHTRDWVTWEAGVGQINKDIWVFESVSDSPRLSVVIPVVQHYVSFEPTDEWLSYIRAIVSSYDDSHFLKAVVAGGGIGAAMAGADRPTGALIGGAVGLLMASGARSRPTGFPIVCPSCRSSYSVHLAGWDMRCPVCNSRLHLG